MRHDKEINGLDEGLFIIYILREQMYNITYRRESVFLLFWSGNFWGAVQRESAFVKRAEANWSCREATAWEGSKLGLLASALH